MVVKKGQNKSIILISFGYSLLFHLAVFVVLALVGINICSVATSKEKKEQYIRVHVVSIVKPVLSKSRFLSGIDLGKKMSFKVDLKPHPKTKKLKKKTMAKKVVVKKAVTKKVVKKVPKKSAIKGSTQLKQPTTDKKATKKSVSQNVGAIKKAFNDKKKPNNLLSESIGINSSNVIDADVIKPIYSPKPVYPLIARKLKHEGEVLLEVLVSLDGRVEKVRVLKPAKYKELTKAAVLAVKRWRFKPLKQRRWVKIPFRFKLKD